LLWYMLWKMLRNM
jgi:hypothetical protein